MIRVSVSFDATQINAKLDELMKRFPERIGEAVKGACEEIEKKAKDKCPVDSRALGLSMQSDVRMLEGQVLGRVGTDLPYAPYVHEGTGIYARDGNGRKKVPWPYIDDKTGEEIWTKGNHPQPFLEDAVNEAAPSLIEHFNDLLGGG